MYHRVDEEEQTINFAFERNYVTDYPSIVSCQSRTDYTVAMEDMEVLMLEYNDLQCAYELYPVWHKLSRMIAEYMLLCR